MVWDMEINGENKSGNWVQAVAPKNKQPAQQQEAPSATPDDDVPF